MDVRDFARAVSARLSMQLEDRCFEPDADLRTDWKMDSLQAMLFVLAIEEMADVEVVSDSVPELKIVADAYTHYLALST